MSYVEVAKDTVIETLGAGQKVIICDFATLRMMNGLELQVTAINSFIVKPETKFFKVVDSE